MSGPRLFKFLVGGLPFGLVILGALSFVIYFKKREKAAAEEIILASTLQRPLSADDFAEYQRILVEFFGPRPAENEEAIRKVANYLESTLGPRNMGFDARQVTPAATPAGTVYVVAELPGDGPTGAVVDVVARIDSPPDLASGDRAGLAAASLPLSGLLCLANRFSGTPQPASLRFVAYLDGGGEGYQAGFNQALALEGKQVTRIIRLSDLFPPDSAADPMTALTGAEAAIKDAADPTSAEPAK